MPEKWNKITEDKLKKISGVCFDIDDTITTQGKLTSDAFFALWQLKEAGYILIPITGRSAAWCDHIVRFWPVDAVVGENGAFTFFMENGSRKRFDTLEDKSIEVKKKLSGLKEKIKNVFPKARWASDQPYREYDVAIDICEDVQPWDESEIKKLLELCEKSGAKAKLSSIHVNAWFGNYDKSTGIKKWMEVGAPGISSNLLWDELVFIGDSPNDAPLFGEFKTSVAVSNISNYLEIIEFKPDWITEAASGAGFREFANRLIDLHK